MQGTGNQISAVAIRIDNPKRRICHQYARNDKEHVETNRGLLKRAVTNLIQNSISHNENGCAVFLSVTADKENCNICVEDNGIGASDEQIRRLSNTPHYMACDSDATEQRHSMGLLIVRQIAEAHNGKSVIGHSQYGGFSVRLVIPLVRD